MENKERLEQHYNELEENGVGFERELFESYESEKIRLIEAVSSVGRATDS